MVKDLNMKGKTTRGNVDFFPTNGIINKISGQTGTEKDRHLYVA